MREHFPVNFMRQISSRSQNQTSNTKNCRPTSPLNIVIPQKKKNPQKKNLANQIQQYKIIHHEQVEFILHSVGLTSKTSHQKS